MPLLLLALLLLGTGARADDVTEDAKRRLGSVYQQLNPWSPFGPIYDLERYHYRAVLSRLKDEYSRISPNHEKFMVRHPFQVRQATLRFSIPHTG